MCALKTGESVLRYQGLFDFDGLYHHIMNFFKRRNYDYIEKGWKEKNATPAGREITIKMIPEKRVAENMKYLYSLEWLSIDAHPVELVQEGKTVTLTHARFSIKVSAQVDPDYQGLGKKKPNLSEFVTKTLLKEELDEHVNNLQREIQALLDSIKNYLHMETSK